MDEGDTLVPTTKSILEFDDDEDDDNDDDEFYSSLVITEDNANVPLPGVQTTKGSQDYDAESTHEYKTEWENVSVIPCAVCQGDPQFTACQGQLVEQIELMAKCRHPMELLAIFNEHDGTDCTVVDTAEDNGFYVIPKVCEYCGSTSLSQCQRPGCERPQSFFARKRPPFSERGQGWDPVTDEEIIATTENDMKEEEKHTRRKHSPERSTIDELQKEVKLDSPLRSKISQLLGVS